MKTEEQNEVIWAVLANEDFFSQKQELKKSLGKYSLVQPIRTALYHDLSALIDAYSKDRFPTNCGE